MLTVWWDGAADGPTNMAADECLAAEAERIGGLVMRIYGWTVPTVSIGGFQPIAAVRQTPELAGVAVVRRPSGGGAIVHGTDLTYAAAVPKGHRWGGDPQAFYDAIHGAMSGELRDRGVAVRLHGHVAGGGAAGAAEPPLFCFDRRSAGDLVVDRVPESSEAWPVTADRASAVGTTPRLDAKIMGSAQRRLAGAVLQHGTLLLEANPAVVGAARHPGLAELLGRRPGTGTEIARAWVARIAATLDVAPDERGGFLEDHEREIAARVRRFLDAAWMARR